MLWIGEVEDAESTDDLITSASLIGRLTQDFENLDCKIASRLRMVLTGTFRKQVTTAKEKCNQRRDHSQADRFLG